MRQKEEVSELKYVTIEEFEKMLLTGDKELAFSINNAILDILNKIKKEK